MMFKVQLKCSRHGYLGAVTVRASSFDDARGSVKTRCLFGCRGAKVVAVTSEPITYKQYSLMLEEAQ